MDKVKLGFKWLVDKVSKVVLDLLGPLDVNKVLKARTNAVNLIVLDFLAFIHALYLEAHVAAHSSYLLVTLKVLIHLV